MSMRKFGTVLMAIGFGLALGALMMKTGNRQLMLLGFALLAIGSVIGVRRRGTTQQTAQKAAQPQLKPGGKKRKKK